MDYTKYISKVTQLIPPSGIRKYFDYIDKDTISLGVGEPDFPTPEGIRQEALQRLSTGRIPYSSNAGMPELREWIGKYLDARFGLKDYAVGDILVTVGASQAIDLTVRALTNPGDEIIIPEPTYVSYVPAVMLSGGKPVIIPTKAETGFKMTPDCVLAALTPKTKAILIPYPNNPTGGIMEYSDLQKIADIAIEHDLMIISDEIYAELTYNGKRHVSIAALPGMRERTVVLNGFSKAFSMTGWRLGYAAGPTPLIAAITKLHQLTMLCAPTPAQYAGIAAIRQGFENNWSDVLYMKNEYDKRRRYMVDTFDSMGLMCHEPEGAFYVFPCVKSTGLSSEEFCDRLLHQKKVVAVPGSAFGKSGEGHIRCCYATDIEAIREALERIKEFLKTL
ncbi:MAG: aminotransferase class I/II-fold pyridoxal phosphate-dependent enzyme [Bacillota bacterium]